MKLSLLVVGILFTAAATPISTVLSKPLSGEISWVNETLDQTKRVNETPDRTKRVNETPDRTKAELPDSILEQPLVLFT